MKKSAAVLGLTLLLLVSAWGSEKSLYVFCSHQYCTDGGMPYSGVIFDSKQQNLYGITMIGGASGYGAVFELKRTSSGWKESLLYSFTGGADGSTPLGPLVFDKSGNLYGITTAGGAGYGTVYELTPNNKTWKFKAIYTFKGGADGLMGISVAGLILDAKGNLYGTTEMGGSAGFGTVFELSKGKSGWKKTILYNFAGGADAADPLTGLTFDSKGNLFGASVGGGAYGGGAVFELKHGSKWTESVIYSFTGGADGSYPEFGALVIDDAGHIYGTAAGGGSANQGVVYRLNHTQSGWQEHVLYTFTGGDDGGQPFSGITFDKDGNIFGTAAYYGAQGDGTVYELVKKSGWKEKTLYTFSGSDGKYPYANVIFDPKGNLYSSTYWGGNLSCNNPPQGCGVVFTMKP
jgi:uncharacterized repeat protein (TIGR03803 family)